MKSRQIRKKPTVNPEHSSDLNAAKVDDFSCVKIIKNEDFQNRKKAGIFLHSTSSLSRPCVISNFKDLSFEESKNSISSESLQENMILSDDTAESKIKESNDFNKNDSVYFISTAKEEQSYFKVENESQLDFNLKKDLKWESQILRKVNLKSDVSFESFEFSNYSQNSFVEIEPEFTEHESLVASVEEKFHLLQNSIEILSNSLENKLKPELYRNEQKIQRENEKIEIQKEKRKFLQNVRNSMCELDTAISNLNLDSLLDHFEAGFRENSSSISPFNGKSTPDLSKVILNFENLIADFYLWENLYKEDFDGAFVLDSLKLILEKYFYRIFLFSTYPVNLTIENLVQSMEQLSAMIPFKWHEHLLFDCESFFAKWFGVLYLQNCDSEGVKKIIEDKATKDSVKNFFNVLIFKY